MVDSGASTSMVQLAFAQKVGITPASRGVRPSSCAFGLGAGTVKLWVAPFDSVQVAGEKIRNAHLMIGELSSEYAYYRSNAPEVLLGGDFLKAHHVLISHSQDKFYFTYSGGQVFPSTPGLDCDDDQVAGKSPKEALAIYDELLSKNPDDAKMLVKRGNLRFASHDFKGAVSDLDAAIRLDPANAVAFMIRSEARAALKDYAGALADTDAAMAAGMATADMYVYRARIRRAMGDTSGMMAEFEQALKLDPHDIAVLRVRGRTQYFQEKYAEADADLSAALAVRPDGFDSIWLYLIRLRRGESKPETLESGMAQLGKDEWPVPVIQYLLDRIDRDALMKAAAADEKTRKGRECEANFYSAERLVISGKKDEARPLLQAAHDHCPANFIEYEAANIELERIK